MRGHSSGFKFQESDITFMEKIPPIQRAALEKINEGKDYKVASEELSISIGTLKSRVNRARKKIIELRGSNDFRLECEPASVP